MGVVEPPKKLGMPPDGGVAGLPRPRLVALTGLFGGAKKSEAGAGAAAAGGVRPAGVDAPEGANEKKPVDGGATGAGAGTSISLGLSASLAWGESGSAMIELAASGDEARGRVEPRRPDRPVRFRDDEGIDNAPVGWAGAAG